MTATDSPTSITDQLFREGKLGECLEKQIEIVRADPSSIPARSFLFALFCFTGDFRRAGLALDAIATQVDHLERETITLRSLLIAETERTEVFTGSGSPLLPPEAPAHVEARLGAVTAARSGDLATAAKRLDEAIALTPAVHARINDIDVESVRDDDDLLGSVLEVFAGGRYVWLALESIRSLELSAPKSVLDLLWIPAQLETTAGMQASIYVPARYRASAEHPDDAVKLGRSTLWLDLGQHIYCGAGQRVLRGQSADGEIEWPVLELRSWRAAEESPTA